MSKKYKDRLGLKKINYILLILATLLMGVGYLIMSFGDISISPLILAVVYVLLIPFALMYKPKDE